MKNIKNTQLNTRSNTIKYLSILLVLIAVFFTAPSTTLASTYNKECNNGGCNFTFKVAGAPETNFENLQNSGSNLNTDTNANYTYTYNNYNGYGNAGSNASGASGSSNSKNTNNSSSSNNSGSNSRNSSNSNNSNSNYSNSNSDTSNNDNGVNGAPVKTTTDLKNLTSNVIFGAGGFLPTGIMDWILIAILILIIVVLARKVFGGESHYHSTPLKHA
jgi:uncharacterized membrane protein YdfJ with MMPL/SSD domain